MLNLRKIPALLAATAIISMAFVTACKKESTLTDDQKGAMAQQSIQAGLFFTSSFSQATQASVKANGFAGDEGNHVLKVRGACTEPTVLPADFFTFPKTVTSNYGTGCTDNDGKLKTGKLTLKVGKFWETGSTIQATFENYTEDGARLEGTYTIVNNSTLGVNNHTFIAENLILTSKEGQKITYNIRQTHKQVGGTGNLNPFDDIYEISTVMSSILPDGTKLDRKSTRLNSSHVD